MKIINNGDTDSIVYAFWVLFIDNDMFELLVLNRVSDSCLLCAFGVAGLVSVPPRRMRLWSSGQVCVRHGGQVSVSVLGFRFSGYRLIGVRHGGMFVASVRMKQITYICLNSIRQREAAPVRRGGQRAEQRRRQDNAKRSTRRQHLSPWLERFSKTLLSAVAEPFG